LRLVTIKGKKWQRRKATDGTSSSIKMYFPPFLIAEMREAVHSEIRERENPVIRRVETR
jgi:hypothetical protein